jgi:branched-chain amino acid transport system permease protein
MTTPNLPTTVPTFTPTMLITWALLASLPLWIEKVGLYQYLGVEILIWATYALAFNLVLGHAGLPSFGHGAFFGIGAYAFGLAQFTIAPNLWVCMGAALLAAALAGALVALFISHRRGIYFSLMTIAFGQVFWFIAMKAHAITGGEDGLLKIARLPVDLGIAALPTESNVALYYAVFAVFVVVSLGLWRLVHSPFGRVVKAIKQNGYDVWKAKFATIVISAGLSGLAGGLFAMAQRSAFPDVMSLHYSGYIVMMTLIGGGLVSYWGPVIGVVVFLLARDLIGAWTTSWMLWFGLLFVILVMFRPDGIAGFVESLRKKAPEPPLPAPASEAKGA